MAIVTSHERAQAHRHGYRGAGGDTGHLEQYMGRLKHESGWNPPENSGSPDAYVRAVGMASSPTGIYPVAYLVTQDPGRVLPKHFHQADQFQVMLPSDGKFGSLPIGDRTMVHFTAACSAYGPLTAGVQPLRYFTLRNAWDAGGMPRSAHQPQDYAIGRKPRSVYGFVPERRFESRSRVDVETILPPDSTGLFALSIRLGPGTSYQVQDLPLGAGQYSLVLEGDCTFAGTRLDRHGIAFVFPDEPRPEILAGDSGASLLVMQYPRMEMPHAQNATEAAEDFR